MSASVVAGRENLITKENYILHIAELCSGSAHGDGAEDAGDQIVTGTNGREIFVSRT